MSCKTYEKLRQKRLNSPRAKPFEIVEGEEAAISRKKRKEAFRFEATEPKDSASRPDGEFELDDAEIRVVSGGR